MQLGAALVGLAWSPSRGLQTPQVVGLACLQQTTSYSPGNKLCAHIHRPYSCHVTDYFLLAQQNIRHKFLLQIFKQFEEP